MKGNLTCGGFIGGAPTQSLAVEALPELQLPRDAAAEDGGGSVDDFAPTQLSSRWAKGLIQMYAGGLFRDLQGLHDRRRKDRRRDHRVHLGLRLGLGRRRPGGSKHRRRRGQLGRAGQGCRRTRVSRVDGGEGREGRHRDGGRRGHWGAPSDCGLGLWELVRRAVDAARKQ